MTRTLALTLALSALATPVSAQQYRHPSSCQDGCMTVSAYRDHGGRTDWNCGGVTYGGHGGTDFAIYGGFAAVDEGREVLAAADGVVVQSHDGEFDRCTTGNCSGGGGFGNYVAIQHPDGVVTFYGHQRTGSIAVGVGDAVSCGQHIGFIASSGSSTGPHVHFEPRSPGGFEPFGGGGCSDPGSRWIDQRAYTSLPGVACPVLHHPPEGWLDAAACEGLRGWARDPDAPTVAIDVVFTIDGALFAPGSVAFRTNASIHRDDVGDHGFSFPVPYGFMDGRDHAVFAYGVGAAGGPLSGIPATLHCDPAPLPFPNGVRRHVTDPMSYGAWQFADSDISAIGDAAIGALPESDPWPSHPQLFAAAGDPAVYLRDVRNGSPARRHVPSPDAMSAWRLDWGMIASVDLATRDTFAGDAPIAARPYLVRRSDGAVYVIDAPPPAPPPVDAGDLTTSDAGMRAAGDAGVQRIGDGGVVRALGDASHVIGASRGTASGCSAGPSNHGSSWHWLVALAALLSARRASR